jgi:hypothetical protein
MRRSDEAERCSTLGGGSGRWLMGLLRCCRVHMMLRCVAPVTRHKWQANAPQPHRGTAHSRNSRTGPHYLPTSSSAPPAGACCCKLCGARPPIAFLPPVRRSVLPHSPLIMQSRSLTARGVSGQLQAARPLLRWQRARAPPPAAASDAAEAPATPSLQPVVAPAPRRGVSLYGGCQAGRRSSAAAQLPQPPPHKKTPLPAQLSPPPPLPCPTPQTCCASTRPARRSSTAGWR